MVSTVLAMSARISASSWRTLPLVDDLLNDLYENVRAQIKVVNALANTYNPVLGCKRLDVSHDLAPLVLELAHDTVDDVSPMGIIHPLVDMRGQETI